MSKVVQQMREWKASGWHLKCVLRRSPDGEFWMITDCNCEAYNGGKICRTERLEEGLIMLAEDHPDHDIRVDLREPNSKEKENLLKVEFVNNKGKETLWEIISKHL